MAAARAGELLLRVLASELLTVRPRTPRHGHYQSAITYTYENCRDIC
ncbi:MAG: hypothetical protein JWL59_4922 [Chthoniobacteraceae bacterium]|nr:hypothetical protein [Chthoniobacteraceae bacterium]